MRIFNTFPAIVFITALLGCESSDDKSPQPELGSVKAEVAGLDGFIDLTLNGSETKIGNATASDSLSFPAWTTLVFDQLLETGQTVNIEIAEQPERSYCEVFEGQDWIFDAEDNSYFSVYCLPHKSGGSAASSIDISETHACSINDGQARCYSDNSRIWRIPAEFNDPQLLKAGYGFSCGAQANQLFCWGDDEYEFLSFAQPETVGAIQEVELGLEAACLIDDEGLKCWGDEANPVVSDYPQGLNSPRNLVVKRASACVLGDAGNAYCWGETAKNGNFPSDLTSVTDIDVDVGQGCALTESSTVTCWGAIDNEKLTPVPDDLGRVSAIAVGYNAVCATTDNGLRCWGSRYAPLRLTDGLVPYPSELVLADDSGCAIEEGGVICFGPFAAGHKYFLR